MAEFARREGAGVRDIRRIFGVIPSCYGQPGSSWGPQSYPALRQMGIPVYLDEATQVGVDGQPFWFDGMLNIFHMEPNLIRPSLDRENQLDATLAKFDRAAENLAAHGGGTISSYFHPTEFVTTEFWDLNFAKGANPERKDWKMPHRRTPEESERCYRILNRYVEHMRKTPGVRFVTAREMPMLYQSALVARGLDRSAIAAHMAKSQTFLVTPDASLSAADMLLILLGMEPQVVDRTRHPARYQLQGPCDSQGRLRTGQGRCGFLHPHQPPLAVPRLDRRSPASPWRISRPPSPPTRAHPRRFPYIRGSRKWKSTSPPNRPLRLAGPFIRMAFRLPNSWISLACRLGPSSPPG